MNRVLPLLSFLFIINNLFSQDALPKDTIWKTGGVMAINANQAYYQHWTAGGTPSIAGVAFLKLFATYEKNKWRWDNRLDVAYGSIAERQRKVQKTDDKLQFDSKLGYNMGKKWYASFLTTFKSQFSPGYEDPELQVNRISDFMSPAYIMTSLGFDHNPTDNLSFFIAPVSIKTTLVLDQELADRGAFGVEAGEWETIVRDTSSIDSTFIAGKNIRYELGAHFKMMYKANLMKNVDFQTKLEIYANYLENFGNLDVNWEGLIDMKINDFLSCNIRVEMIYDDDIDIYTGTDDEGIEHFGPRMQIKQLFGLGLSYNF